MHLERFRHISPVVVDDGQVVQIRRDIGVVGPDGFLVDCERTQVVAFGAVVVLCLSRDDPEIVQRGSDPVAILAVQALANSSART